MHTKAGMRLSDDPSSSWKAKGFFFKDARVYSLRYKCIKRAIAPTTIHLNFVTVVNFNKKKEKKDDIPQ